ncbi:unnamed protein product, partial [marine sediment metagenome]
LNFRITQHLLLEDLKLPHNILSIMNWQLKAIKRQ